MTTIVIAEDDDLPFVAIPNTTARDKRLSWKARGILGFLLSHRAGFQLNADNLAGHSEPDGRDATATGLKELVEAGYLIRNRRNVGGGRFEWTYTVYRTPRTPSPGNPSMAPSPGFPSTAEPSTANPGIREDQGVEDPSPTEKAADLTVIDGGKSERQRAGKAEANLARQIVQSWWDTCEPKPVQPFPAITAVVKRCISAGWTPDAIRIALRKVREDGMAVSGATLEIALGKRQDAAKAKHGPFRNPTDPTAYDPSKF